MASPAARTGAEEEEQVPTPHYYATYYGHAAKHLSIVHATLRRAQPGSGISRRTAIFLAGDSSLDNKYWCVPFWAARGAVRARHARPPHSLTA